jgi:mannose-1-phosphate guanylyltransferase
MHDLRALLLAAGTGTRLRPLTDLWPKCLMPVRARPILGYWLEALQALGVQGVLVNTHHHAEQVSEFLSQDRYKKSVRFVYEPRLLGTAGTVRMNADFFQGHTMLLIHADNWCQCNFGSFISYHFLQRPSSCPLTMMTFDTDSPEACGVVETDARGVVFSFYEKVINPPGRRANAAVYLLEQEVVNWILSQPALTDFSTEVLPQYLGRIATWHNSEIHRDIGTLAALRTAQADTVKHHYTVEKDEWQRDFESSPIFNELMRYIEPRGLLDE